MNNEDKNTQESSSSPEMTLIRKRSAGLSFNSSPNSNENFMDSNQTKRRKQRRNCNKTVENNNFQENLHCSEQISEMDNKGDGIRCKNKKFVAVTPPNKEVGQGDCLPSTSSSDSTIEQSTAYAYSQLAHVPRRVVECEGFVQFTKSDDSMKWERKFKLQILYSEDPFNIEEYIIWGIYYTGDNKCRRNLLPLFEKLAKEEEMD